MSNFGSGGEGSSKPLVEAIVVSPGHDCWVKKGEPPLQHGALIVCRAELVAGRGIVGDRYAAKPRNHRAQISFIAADVVDEIRRTFNLPELPVTVFRRNLVVRHIGLENLVGKRFTIQGVQFDGVQECKPCRWMDRMVAEGARQFMMQHFRGGLRAKILCDGVITCHGDAGQS